MIDLNSGLQFLKGVGPKRAELFSHLGIFSIEDLIRFYPRKYRTLHPVDSIFDAPEDENICIKGIVSYPPSTTKIPGGKLITKTAITDMTNSVDLVFFNNRYIDKMLNEGDELLFFGKITRDKWGLRQMISPQFFPLSMENTLEPIYPQTAGLQSKNIAKVIHNALGLVKPYLEETLPDYLLKKYKLPSLYSTLKMIHFPNNEAEVAAARRRLVFEELLILQLAMFSLRNIKSIKTPIKVDYFFTDEYLNLLPFKLTNVQKRSISECLSDMQSGKAMNRLLQGDVGSGKTAVAAALIYNIAKNGYQSALMAPTEVLSRQHFATLKNLFENTDIRVEIITGSTGQKDKRIIKEKLKNGEIDFIIGTHALIQKDVEFKNLGLVITDEQHRFGVKQRSDLAQKGDRPHTLVMSATPIPRTLALMIYGDLDISILDELPPGRIPIDTVKVDSRYHNRIYNFIKKEVDSGRQAYIVCPLVEEGDYDITPAVGYSQMLQKGAFKNYNVGLLHGRMKSAEKDEIMQKFYDGEIQILVSTVVIEVGIDVPNATVMLIENAERFGVSQLHQLRGRIGRGGEKSYCILVSDAQNKEACERLETLVKTSDGFKIAEYDLQTRGPGDFFGHRQHGLPEMKIADLMSDTKILYSAQGIAEEIIKKDAFLKNKENVLLRKSVENLLKKME
ncbi:MAG TPA: ATP-dependent DNA helicase RecG [Clostridiales bacterium]|nr:ATP-dependent DNA helicase RecG [Clostridiales bacterium]